METSSLSPSPPIIAPDDHPFDIAAGVSPPAAAQGTRRHPGAGVGAGEQLPQSPPAFDTLSRRRWQRYLAWSGLGLLVSFVWGVPWLSRQPPLVPPSPRVHSDRTASALPGTIAPVALPAATRPSARSQGPVGHASTIDAAPGGATSGIPFQPPTRSLARGVARRESRAIAAPRAARARRPQHAKRHHATTRPREIEYKPVGSTHHRREPLTALPASRPAPRRVAPDPTPQVQRPWNWYAIPTTGDG
jgi:hypothetical protein